MWKKLRKGIEELTQALGEIGQFMYQSTGATGNFQGQNPNDNPGGKTIDGEYKVN